jgi:hypothetical protein
VHEAIEPRPLDALDAPRYAQIEGLAAIAPHQQEDGRENGEGDGHEEHRATPSRQRAPRRKDLPYGEPASRSFGQEPRRPSLHRASAHISSRACRPTL